MTSPLVERLREGIVEAVHFGSAVATTASADFLFQIGDASRMVLPRSAAKLLLALPFVRSGAIDSGVDERLVLAAASHVGESAQLAALEGWALALGVAPSALESGPDLPLARMKRADSGDMPSVFHNNNVGKHLGVLATCRHLGEDIAGYCDSDHPAQRRLIASLCSVCDLAMPAQTLLDNCGMRTMPIPLDRLALGMARLAVEGQTPGASSRLLNAIAKMPDFLAGTRRLVTQIIVVTQGRIIAKGGSEGIFAALDRARGIGHALKIDDGSSEAASAAIVEWLAATGSLRAEEAAVLREQTRFWRHPFAPERSPVVRFPFVEQLGKDALRQS